MKIIIAFLLAVTGGSALAVTTSETASAHHVCDDLLLFVPHPDVYRVECYGRGRGWFKGYATCYKPVWVIENGVVVKFYKEYKSVETPAKFKSRREHHEIARARCTSAFPFLETNQWLSPWYVKWH